MARSLTMRAFKISLALLLACVAFSRAAEPRAYFGNWSNGRGETLVITARTLQFAEDDPVPYRDLTRGTDGAHFELQIAARGEVNAFAGKTLLLELRDDDSMKMTGYRSHAEAAHGGEEMQVVTWFRDEADEHDGD